jgi:peptidoglycan/LPS O-acetylase OafA/YrhL
MSATGIAVTQSAAAASTAVAGSAAPRFEYIDGLRGLASIMVAIGHLAGAAEAQHPGILGPGVMHLASFGRYGVQIFFVLSGFVIAHSVITGAYSFGYFGRFVGRRFVRLDVPYWSVIALELVLLAVSGMLMAQYSRDLPSLPQIVANMFYLQQYLGYDHIVPVFWTLCYEVQFYLVYVLSLVLLAKLQNAGASSQTVRRIATFALAVSFCWSLAMYLGLMVNPHRGLFVDRWYQFAFGVVTYLYFRGHVGWLPVASGAALCVICGLAFSVDGYRLTSTLLTAATGIAILASLRYSWWNSLMIGPGMQFLGRVSYSLYLLHSSIGWRATVVTRELFGNSYSTAAAYVAFAVGLGASIFASYIMYLLIERPAINLARKIRLPQRHAAALNAH